MRSFQSELDSTCDHFKNYAIASMMCAELSKSWKRIETIKYYAELNYTSIVVQVGNLQRSSILRSASQVES